MNGELKMGNQKVNAYLYAVHLAWQIRIFVSAKDNCLFDDCYYLAWCSAKHASWSTCVRICIKIALHMWGEKKSTNLLLPFLYLPLNPLPLFYTLSTLYSSPLGELVCAPRVGRRCGPRQFHLALFHRLSFFNHSILATDNKHAINTHATHKYIFWTAT